MDPVLQVAPVAPGDPSGPVLSDYGYRRICDLVRERFGIHLSSHKQLLVINRLSREVSAMGFESYESYADHVDADPTGQAAEALASLISTNHTYFFREPAHFDYLREVVLPRLAALGDKDLRIWCAAASTGEEAYSIAITMMEHFGARYDALDAGVLATDLSLRALRQAQTGRYRSDQLDGIGPGLRGRYFRAETEQDFVVTPQLRAEVLFRKFNLVRDEYAFRRRFHVIFCRNVMIYFDLPTRRQLFADLYEVTAPGGHLFVGHCETLGADPGGYRLVAPAVYQRPAVHDAALR